MKAYKYKLKLNARFAAACDATLKVCRELYNAALQERRDAYRISGLSINYHAQAVQLPDIKQVRDDESAVYSQVLQDTLRRLDQKPPSCQEHQRRGMESIHFDLVRQSGRGWPESNQSKSVVDVAGLLAVRSQSAKDACHDRASVRQLWIGRAS